MIRLRAFRRERFVRRALARCCNASAAWLSDASMLLDERWPWAGDRLWDAQKALRRANVELRG